MNINQTIMDIFQVPEAAIQDVSILKGGLTNNAWHFRLQQSEYVLRIPGYGTNKMIPRDEEYIHEHLIAALQIDAPLRYFDAETGVKVSDFLTGETLTSSHLRTAEHMIASAQLLQKLHTAAITSDYYFNVFDKLIQYETLASANDANYFENYAQVRDAFFALQKEISRGYTPILCHNDMVAENIMYVPTENKYYLIDWEYAGMNDPLFDIAGLFLENDCTEEQQLRFFEAYGLEPNPEILRRIKLHQISQDFLWAVWGLYKHALGQISYDYGYNRFMRAAQMLAEVQDAE